MKWKILIYTLHILHFIKVANTVLYLFVIISNFTEKKEFILILLIQKCIFKNIKRILIMIFNFTFYFFCRSDSNFRTLKSNLDMCFGKKYNIAKYVCIMLELIFYVVSCLFNM